MGEGIKSAGPVPGDGGGSPLAFEPTPDGPIHRRPSFNPSHEQFAPRSSSLRDAGRDPRTGKVIPHKFSAKVAARVAQLIASGATAADIAVLLNIRPGHLKQYYSKQLEFGQVAVNMDVAGAVLRQAKNGKNMRASEFWLKNRAGWDKDQKEVPAAPLMIHIHS